MTDDVLAWAMGFALLGAIVFLFHDCNQSTTEQACIRENRVFTRGECQPRKP